VHDAAEVHIVTGNDDLGPDDSGIFFALHSVFVAEVKQIHGPLRLFHRDCEVVGVLDPVKRLDDKGTSKSVSFEVEVDLGRAADASDTSISSDAGFREKLDDDISHFISSFEVDFDAIVESSVRRLHEKGCDLVSLEEVWLFSGFQVFDGSVHFYLISTVSRCESFYVCCL